MAAELVRAARPRHWLKNVLVFAAPCSPAGSPSPRCWASPRSRSWRSASRRPASTWSTTRATSTSTAPTPPSGSARSPLGTVSVRLAMVVGGGLMAASLVVGALVNVPAAPHAGGVRRHLAALLLLAQGRAGHRHRHRRVRLPAARHRRRRRRRHRRCRSGSCSARPSARSSWRPASGTPRSQMEHDDPALFRASLGRYTPTYLRFVWTLSAGILIMTYGLWAFEQSALNGSAAAGASRWRRSCSPCCATPWPSTRARPAEPVDIAWQDHVLQVLARGLGGARRRRALPPLGQPPSSALGQPQQPLAGRAAVRRATGGVVAVREEPVVGVAGTSRRCDQARRPAQLGLAPAARRTTATGRT